MRRASQLLMMVAFAAALLAPWQGTALLVCLGEGPDGYGTCCEEDSHASCCSTEDSGDSAEHHGCCLEIPAPDSDFVAPGSIHSGAPKLVLLTTVCSGAPFSETVPPSCAGGASGPAPDPPPPLSGSEVVVRNRAILI